VLKGPLAVVPVRAGELGTGGDETLAEAGGSGLLVGSGTGALSEVLLATGVARVLELVELGSFRPGEWAEAVAPVVEEATVAVLPASADGRDLAPRLAGVLGWPLVAGAIRLTVHGAAVVRWQGRQIAHCEVDGPFVATLLPGSRSVPEPPASRGGSDDVIGLQPEREPGPGRATATTSAASTTPAGGPVEPERAPATSTEPVVASGGEPELVEVLDADPAVVDLREAPRIIAGGAGLGGPEEFRLLAGVAARIGASVGGTRVVTDAGVLPHDRQIGTTGVSVRPRCYLALGISGAAQHVGGLGSPEHVISVNLDRSCPMMSMADLALVADAPAVLRALAARLAPPAGEPA
jgi:electron transfer flavoprotein alpha subunit